MENRRILVIDEDTRAVDTVRAAMRPFRVDVEVQPEPGRAFERAREEPPHLIILAVELTPQKQGYNLCRRLKKTFETQAVPVLMVSAGDPYLEDHRRLQTRADEYLLKPFSVDSLLSKVETIVGRFSRAASGVQSEIIDLEEEDIPPPEITLIAEVPEEEVRESDIAESVNLAVAPARRPRVTPLAQRAEEQNGEIDVDAMFEVVTRSSGAQTEAAPVATVVTAAPTAPPVIDAPAPPPLPPPPPAAPGVDAELEAREREVLDLRERTVEAQRLLSEERERTTALETQLASTRTRLATLESANTQGSALAEELAARDRELAERAADLERLTTDYAQRLDQAEAAAIERVTRLRTEHDAQLHDARLSAQRDRAEMESSLLERMHDAEALHQRSLDEARVALAQQTEGLRREVATLRTESAELERLRRDVDVQIAERVAAAADEARRPLEEELGNALERHAHELAEHKRQHQSRVSDERNRTLAAEARIPPLEARVTELERVARNATEQQDSFARELTSTRNALSEAISARAMLEQEFKRLESSMATVTARAKDATMQADVLRRQLGEREARIRELEAAAEGLREGEARAQSAESHAKDLEAQLADRGQQLRSLDARVTGLEGEVLQRDAQLAELRDSHALDTRALQTELTSLRERAAPLERERSAMEAMTQELRRQVEALADERTTMQTELQALRETLAAAEAERVSLAAAKQGAEQRLEAEAQRGERLRQALETLNSLMRQDPAARG